MKTTTPKKDKTIRFTISTNVTKAFATGHIQHRGGGGQHIDRRTARNRTRSQQRQSALGEW